MYQLIFVFTATVSLALIVLQILMLIRVILSLFPIDEDSPFFRFIYFTTEIFVMPVRLLFEHFGWFEGFPLDMSFFVTFILISFLSMFL